MEKLKPGIYRIQNEPTSENQAKMQGILGRMGAVIVEEWEAIIEDNRRGRIAEQGHIYTSLQTRTA